MPLGFNSLTGGGGLSASSGVTSNDTLSQQNRQGSGAINVGGLNLGGGSRLDWDKPGVWLAGATLLAVAVVAFGRGKKRGRR